MTQIEAIAKLVEVTKQKEELEKREKELRDEVAKKLPVGNAVTHDGYVVENKLVEEAIVDVGKLTQINPTIVARATVQPPAKLDRELIKEIGKKEGYVTWETVPRVYVRKVK